jgi:HPt (histidine-containing phosphotransfer) domain-containing protein
MTLRLMKYNGWETSPSSKAEVRRWAARIREDLRDIARAIEAEDINALVEFAHDASGAAAELEAIAEATKEEYAS